MTIVCPSCQFENPGEAQICEQCGTSLVEQPCFNCDTRVPLAVENCPNCGAATGKTWWVVIIPADQVNTEAELRESEYLDSNHRYRIISDIYSSEDCFIETRVLDCSPLAMVVEPTETPLVKLYLSLGEKLPDLIPALHNTWCDTTGEYLLLADRSDWQTLKDISPLPTLQLLAYLNQMSVLWQEFTEPQLTKSLLDVNNFFLDEDECLVLQKIFQNTAPEDLHLSNLGQLWSQLFPTDEASIQNLYEQLSSGLIATIPDLLSALEEVESQLDLAEYSLPSIVLDGSSIEEEELEIPNEPTEGDNLPTLVLPMQLLSLTDAAVSDIGQQRNHNEDFYGIVTRTEKQENSRQTKYTARGLYIVCDGMGGHAAGEVASQMAVESLKEYFRNNWGDKLPCEETIRQGILLTNHQIYQENLQNGRSGSGRMGTTLVMVLIHDHQAAIAHVGDSRVYHITRKRGLNQFTLDHAVAQQEILCGVEPEIAYRRHDAYQLTQALGPRDNSCVEPEIQFIDFKEDTVLFLCSDGFSDHNFLETEAKSQLLSLVNSKVNLEQELKKLMEMANQHNGHDNLTAIIVKVKVQPSLERAY